MLSVRETFFKKKTKKNTSLQLTGVKFNAHWITECSITVSKLHNIRPCSENWLNYLFSNHPIVGSSRKGLLLYFYSIKYQKCIHLPCQPAPYQPIWLHTDRQLVSGLAYYHQEHLKLQPDAEGNTKKGGTRISEEARSTGIKKHLYPIKSRISSVMPAAFGQKPKKMQLGLHSVYDVLLANKSE